MKIGIIGGGASGMAAAIAASSCGAAVTILEQNNRVGNKILSTGNGKCNLSNLFMSPDCYHSEDERRIEPVLKQFSVEDTLDFFHALGLMTREKNGYLYPACEQASAVLDVLRFALARYGVSVETDCRVLKAQCGKDGFVVHTGKAGKQKTFCFDRLILACGSCAGQGKSEAENGMELAGGFSLKRIPFLPALTALRCQEPYFRSLAGVRCQAEVLLSTEGKEYRERGELQITDYGISGIPVFQLSRYAAKTLVHCKSVSVFLDFLPDMDAEEWKRVLTARLKELGQESAERFFTGTVHKKIISVILKNSRISPGDITGMIPRHTLFDAGNMLKRFPATVTGTNSFAKAQVCAGGVRLSEVTDCLEARRQKGLYIIGELLDVDGRCGGYNLQWAWTTGVLAGRAAAEKR